MRITESQLRRIVREEAARLLPEGDLDDLDMPGMSRYGLYGDDQDVLFDSVLVPLARAVAKARADLEELTERFADQGAQDPEARSEIWGAFDAACRGRQPRR